MPPQSQLPPNLSEIGVSVDCAGYGYPSKLKGACVIMAVQTFAGPAIGSVSTFKRSMRSHAREGPQVEHRERGRGEDHLLERDGNGTIEPQTRSERVHERS